MPGGIVIIRRSQDSSPGRGGRRAGWMDIPGIPRILYRTGGAVVTVSCAANIHFNHQHSCKNTEIDAVN